MKSFEFDSKEISQWSKEFSQQLNSKTVILLDGPLGAGKTHLVQNILKHLVISPITSPTFSLIHQYQGIKTPSIYHLDLYRLDTQENLESIGFWDLFNEDNSIIFIEWSDRLIQSELPLDWKKIKIKIEFSENPEKRIYKMT